MSDLSGPGLFYRDRKRLVLLVLEGHESAVRSCPLIPYAPCGRLRPPFLTQCRHDHRVTDPPPILFTYE